MNQLRAIELFSGIGGFAAAAGDRLQIAAAIDINGHALDTYRNNFAHSTCAKTLESLSAESLAACDADLWWLSPPCQPYCQRGQKRDAADPRADSLKTLIAHIGQLRPRYVALENVPGFDGSLMQQRLLQTLRNGGYHIRQWQLCPVQLGIPNRRRRYYLLAGQTPLQRPQLPQVRLRPLAEFLDPRPSAELLLSESEWRRYQRVLHVVDADDPQAIAVCFTASYGNSPIRSGSCLRTADGVRRFSVAEVLRLLGFADSFAFPPDMSWQTAWRLLGNSLSVPVVRHVLSSIHELRDVSTFAAPAIM